MIRFTSMSSEHKDVPNSKLFCTYAWIETDEIDSEEFAIAVMDYKPSHSKRTEFIFSEPIWNWIAEDRTEEQQKFIDKNFDKLNELFIDFAQKNGYLRDVK